MFLSSETGFHKILTSWGGMATELQYGSLSSELCSAAGENLHPSVFTGTIHATQSLHGLTGTHCIR